MSKYTTELRFVCETLAGKEESVGASGVNEIIDEARPKIFDFEYDLFDPLYKPVLERKILRHYYTREIAFETYGLWKMHLETKINELLPLYNKLYEAEKLKYQPLFDVDVTTEHKGENSTKDVYAGNDARTLSGADTMKHTGTDTKKFDGKQDATDKTDATADSWNYYSDTPQGGITGLANHKYLTNATHDTGTQHTESEGHNVEDNTEKNIYDSQNVSEYGKVDTLISNDLRDIKGTAEYTEHIFGKRGAKTYAEMMIEYRKSLINIDEMFIRELKDLFFLLW